VCDEGKMMPRDLQRLRVGKHQIIVDKRICVRERALAGGATAFLRKPYGAELFIKTLRAALDWRTLRRFLARHPPTRNKKSLGQTASTFGPGVTIVTLTLIKPFIHFPARHPAKSFLPLKICLAFFRHPNILRKKQLRAKLPLVLRWFSSLTLHQSLQSPVDLYGTTYAEFSLAGEPLGANVRVPTPGPRPSQVTKSIMKPMRDSIILAVSIVSIIGGILIQLWRWNYAARP
jgi:hypothetical protein